VGVTPTPATILRLESSGARFLAKGALRSLGVGGRFVEFDSKLRLGKPVFREVIRLPDCKSGVNKQSRK
jgi:hypothetical protein